MCELHDVDGVLEILRSGLARHGVTLPSLGLDPGEPVLIELGRVNLGTGHLLAEVLHRAAEVNDRAARGHGG